MIGVRGHDIGKMSAELLAETLVQRGFESIQLVTYKSIDGISAHPGYLTPGLAFSIGKEFDKRHIHIAMLGSYFNLIDQEPGAVEQGIKRFKEYLRYAKEFKCHLVGTETGSYEKDWTYHPDNNSEDALNKVIEIFKELTIEAQRYGVIVGIEGAYNHVVSTPQRMKKVLDAVDSNNIQVIFDPVNLLHIGNYAQSQSIIDQAFELYGDRIVLIHAKDFVIHEGHLKQVAIGEGLMDYQYLGAILKERKPSIDVIIEGLTGEGLEKSRLYLKEMLGL